ncbi:MAG: antibiotic biosynthesis monooxygenase [Alphaproteobacteria bacterium]|nr:antibiotic biosynthesis monooxygenase [Alphaproteobacteria bacterium]
MIIVTGAVTATPDSFETLKAACLAHTRRSRAEPGCISHDVFIDAENAMRLFFFERWADRAALEAHFAVPGARAFVREMRAAAAAVEGPTIDETAP